MFHCTELEESPATVKNPRQLMMKHTVSCTNITGHDPGKSSKVSFETSDHSDDSARRIARQATRMYMERQKSKIGYEMLKHTPSTLSIGQTPTKLERQFTKGVFPVVGESEERLDVRVDALNNITHEPTDQQIRRQLHRWETEYSLSKHEKPVADSSFRAQPLKPKPKQTKSFYDLRKAMVNREDVSLEHSSIIIRPMPVIEDKALLKKGEIKIYAKDPNFEYRISRDAPPGFEITVDATESEIRCKDLVHSIQAEAVGNYVRKEIEDVLQLWKSNGFLKNIEEYVLSVAPGSNYFVSELASYIFSANASYLATLSANDMHMQLAKAFAIYCWIGNNMSINIASMLADDKEQYSIDVENRSASFDHCALFVKLALHADLQALIINGKVRTWKKLNDDLNFPSPHSWNVVSFLLSHLMFSSHLTPILSYFSPICR